MLLRLTYTCNANLIKDNLKENYLLVLYCILVFIHACMKCLFYLHAKHSNRIYNDVIKFHRIIITVGLYEHEYGM